MRTYDHKPIEQKWQKEWEKQKRYEASEDSDKKKTYLLVEFPYPSGAGLHTGHVRSYTAMDVVARKRRAQGENVLYPMGWDAFGLPTENYAIKTGIAPKVVTKENTDTFRRQLKSLGFSFDWSREINTTDPAYYRWTQWIFLRLFKKGLAYKASRPINWCLSCKIGLADEEVVGGVCERCGGQTEKRQKEQWMLAITKYADRLDKDLDGVDYLPKIKIQQRNWIGKSEGAEVRFALQEEKEPTFYQFFEPGTIRDGEPFVERNCIVALVKHWSEDKYIGLKWKKVNWETLITGGIEQGQNAEEAAIQEIREETGYKNPKLIKELGTVHSRFFHVPKKENRFGHFDILYVELEDGEREELSEEEKANHEPQWLTPAQMDTFGFPASHTYVWEKFKNDGKSRACEVTVFTTRPDTLFGATYLVLAPEHPLVSHYIHQASNAKEIDAYIKNAAQKKEIDRTAEGREKTGVELKGIKAINPATKEELPVWVADYVLAHYGTGAIMAVPAHDERDFEFAKKFNLPIRQVIAPETGTKRNNEEFRDGGCAVVFDPKTQKYAVAHWPAGWYGLFSGGVNEGEDLKQAVLREVEEESGLHDFAHVEEIETAFAHYHNTPKNVDRFAKAICYLTVLNSRTVKEQKLETHEVFELAWATPSEILENWKEFNADGAHDHWVRFLKQAVARAIELGYDTTSDPAVFMKGVHVGPGVLINSGDFSGTGSEEAKGKITAFVRGEMKTTYKLRDWVFSRQRYWGEPIPLVFCGDCKKRAESSKLQAPSSTLSAGELLNPGWIPIPDDMLPVELPEVGKYTPTDTGESPLAAMDSWVKTTCPKCGAPATRETDTMPNWAGSSWYFLRYADPHNEKEFAGKEKLQYWTPIDWYNGGMEHTTLHLLYSRFWHKFLYDEGLVPTSEPYSKRTSHGLILAEGGEKMSKSKGNVVNPDDAVQHFGADTLRLYEMFMGPFDQAIGWSSDGLLGPRRFLERVWDYIDLQKDFFHDGPDEPAIDSLLHQTIRKVSDDIEAMKFNTAISSLMVFVNAIFKRKGVGQIPGTMSSTTGAGASTSTVLSKTAAKAFLRILAPFAPHITEELWRVLRNESSIHDEPWPSYDETRARSGSLSVVVQVNGKIRGSFETTGENLEPQEAEALARAVPAVAKWLAGKRVRKVIFAKKNRLVNFVTE